MNALASVYALPAQGEASWARALRAIGAALEVDGYRVARDPLHPARSDDLESSLLVLSGTVGRSLAEHPGAKIVDIDCYEHVHIPGCVMIVAELSSGHLHGVTIPLINPSPHRAPVIEDAGPVLMLEGA